MACTCHAAISVGSAEKVVRSCVKVGKTEPTGSSFILEKAPNFLMCLANSSDWSCVVTISKCSGLRFVNHKPKWIRPFKSQMAVYCVVFSAKASTLTVTWPCKNLRASTPIKVKEEKARSLMNCSPTLKSNTKE